MYLIFKYIYSHFNYKIFGILGILASLILVPVSLVAANSYVSSSQLAQGRWVKVSVTQTGVHFLSNRQLADMGFSDPQQVYVFGYGAQRISDHFTPTNFIDDLPATPVYRSTQGIYFFAYGPKTLTNDAAGHTLLSQNPFTSFGYYYISNREGIDAANLPSTAAPSGTTGNYAETFTQALNHELDAYSPGETGHYLVGEDLKYTTSRTFGFDLPDLKGDRIQVGASIMTNLSAAGAWAIDVNGDSKDIAAPVTSTNVYVHGDALTGWIDTEAPSGNSVNVKISLQCLSSTVRAAHVDWVTVNYQRLIKVPQTGSLFFNTSAQLVKIEDTTDNTVVWDVTDPTDMRNITLTRNTGGTAFFSAAGNGVRNYVAFNTSNVTGFPSPGYVAEVPNQDLHASVGADMIIFTTTQGEQSARRLAAYRQNASGITVEVINHNDVYNEFSSGSPDVNAMRKFLKMLYDRAQAGNAIKPRYVLIMGRATFDNRHLTAATATLNYETMPTWQTDDGLSDNSTYCTDDILGFLDDYSGLNIDTDTLCVAIGRLPVTTAASAADFVDKIIDYETASPQGSWRTKAVFIADDDDNGVHMRQTEQMLANLKQTEGANRLLIEKIYIDEYDYINGTAVEARNEFNRYLNEGTLWVNYIGHASTTAWSAEGILKYSDMNSLYLKKLPFVYAATCDFMRWDASEISGAEILGVMKGGGVIGVISATRPVYINENAYMSNSMGFAMGAIKEGLNLTIGEMMQMAKNNVGKDDNKLRYVMLGDPSMHLLAPSKKIVVETMADTPFPNDDEPHVLQGRQDLTVTGYVADAVTGEIDTNFNGTVSSTLFDAQRSVTTQGHGTSGVQYSFQKHGTRLFAGNDSVTSGYFTVNIAMPAEVADNYDPASLLLYAYDKKGDDAAVVEDRFYVYGTDDNAVADTIPPVIEAMYLNHPSFINGSIVNPSPTLIAEISDNHAINMSLAGIGHWMTLTLDGTRTYSDVSNYYEPKSLETGTLYYPLNDLEDGSHILTLRVWDASGNSTTANIGFYVDRSAPIQVYDIYVTQSPASETASFYLVHDRPDADLKVEFMVYDITGRAVWLNTTTGKADRYTSFPITWNLTDRGGRRVQRGIYLYRAVVTELGNGNNASQAATPTRKLAVTSR